MIGVTIDDVRALASTLERSYEALVRDRVKFRVGRIVYLAFSRDDSLMGFAFPKDERQALVAAEPHKFMLPEPGDMRYNWVVVRLAEIDRDEMTEIVVEAWRMVVPKKVFNAYERGEQTRMTDPSTSDVRTGETVELLQQMIRNRCVNDGTADSGYETRNADLLRTFLGSTGLDLQHFEPTPGRGSLVARIEGSDPSAPSLCLMGHTDVVPVNESGWSRDPFGGELVDGEVWGRGAVDMLNLTASMAVAFRHLATSGFRPRGDLIYFAVADEESGSAHGMQWMADHEPEAIRADYVLTENGGLHSGPKEQPYISINVGEKGVAWRRLRVRGTPGHGSVPFKANNALLTAAAVMQRIGDYRPAPRFHELWTTTVESLGLDEPTKQSLLDESRIDEFLDTLPHPGPGAHLHACTHTTFSCNMIAGGSTRMKMNVIPDCVEIGVDVRTLPGEGHDDVTAHLRAALGDLYDKVEVEVIMDDPASISRVDGALWASLERAVSKPFPTARPTPQLVVGFTDARIYRNMGAVAYGAGLFSPDVEPADFGRRFHGNDERIDVESLRLTTQLWLDVVRDLHG